MGRPSRLLVPFLGLLCSVLVHTSCDHRAERVVGAAGVVWDRVTPPEAIEPEQPDWALDSIAFQVRSGGLDRVAVSREDGSGFAVLPEIGSSSARSPRWVRSGVLIYSSDLMGSEDLWYRVVESGETRRLTAYPGMEWTPVPRPLSPGIAYVDGADPTAGRIVLVPDTAATPLEKIYLTPASLRAGEPSFSPSGDRVCFTVRANDGSSQIWALSFTDTLPVQLTVASSLTPLLPQIDRSPRFRPDGSSILMASNRGGVWGVWGVSPLGEGHGLRVIAQDLPGAEIRNPAWSPGGSEILLSSNRGGSRALWRLSNLGF